ncbi:hypothetical protein M413DRAFT_66140 [Hebeloma cylindrosporum]|uniref:CID domain-containing protein n=1 Tax=Hebeloma cylindrosporum TaxID=76867 RepID=A0A0C2YWA4_HEBCY|nr:hypothetical protein M413DRAFT_66140 [Hebeloma cylindrosporum h7]
MDKTKTKLAAFFDNDEDDTSFLQKPVDDMKLSHYTAGKVRKSRREKDQEAADAKKREEEVNAAQAYAEFLDAFEGGDVARKKGSSGFVKADSNMAYAPSIPSSERRAPPREVLIGIREQSQSPAVPPPPKPKGKRAMDSFLEEIKRDQAEREAKYSRHGPGHGRSVTAMAAYDGQSGSKDRGDPQTTNLFVANLPHHVTEPGLGKFFARAGPVGSVKVMWPRSDATIGPGADMTASRKSKNTGLNGFVSFMTRRDAEDALREFDGYDWGGSVLRVGWSKAVPIAAKPLYAGAEAGVGATHPTAMHPAFATLDIIRGRNLHDDGETVTDTFIRAVAAEVKDHDSKYEEALREREKSNPKYNFLLRRDHRRHAYYRGLIETEEPLKPAFDDDVRFLSILGYNSVYSSDSAEEAEREQSRKNALTSSARQRFEAMLRALSGKRGEIARCMTFSLEHAEAAHEVADIIIASLLVDGTAVPRKVARLHLICDILHNSAASVPNAWKYRQEFQARLGIVFDHLANIYHSFPGRITADLFKKQITTVVDIWEDWIVFPPEFTSELRTRLEGAVVRPEIIKEETTASPQPLPESFSSRFKTSTFQIASEANPVGSGSGNASDGEPMDVSSDGKGGSDLDGEPVEDIDIDGVPVDDIDGEPLGESGQDTFDDDLDGEPIADDIDGIPLDDDNDGVSVQVA